MAEAFVRVRPDVATFKTETTAGVTAGLGGSDQRSGGGHPVGRDHRRWASGRRLSRVERLQVNLA